MLRFAAVPPLRRYLRTLHWPRPPLRLGARARALGGSKLALLAATALAAGAGAEAAAWLYRLASGPLTALLTRGPLRGRRWSTAAYHAWHRAGVRVHKRARQLQALAARVGADAASLLARGELPGQPPVCASVLWNPQASLSEQAPQPQPPAPAEPNAEAEAEEAASVVLAMAVVPADLAADRPPAPRNLATALHPLLLLGVAGAVVALGVMRWLR
jgi:hypothetical protein